MARILAISSAVAVGHVGLSAIRPALAALGHEVLGLPSVVLSGHGGWPAVARAPMPVAALERMLAAMDGNGWLHGIDAVLTGYLPGPAHARFAAKAIRRVRRQSPEARILVDPVLGDAPKGLYVSEEAAEAIRDHLLPRATTLTPNLFELGWLSGLPVETEAEALTAARSLTSQERQIVVTSAPCPPGMTGVLDVTAEGALRHAHPAAGDVPKGAGDVLAGLLAAGLDTGSATGLTAALLDQSRGRDHLALASGDLSWKDALAAPGVPAGH